MKAKLSILTSIITAATLADVIPSSIGYHLSTEGERPATVTVKPTPPPRLSFAVALPTTQLTLLWTYSGQLSTNVSFNVYTTDVVTNPIWSLMTNVSDLQVSFQAVPKEQFFRVTSTNSFWGMETPPSPVASTPPIPVTPANVTIKPK